MKVPEANDSFLNVTLTGQVETSCVAGGARWFNRQENINSVHFSRDQSVSEQDKWPPHLAYFRLNNKN